jgi:hypothetical protein
MPKPVILGTAPEFLARDGLTDTVQPWEDGLRAKTGPGSFEWWYFDAHLNDGSTAVIVFATKPILERGGPLKPNVSLTITRPDGTKTAAFPIFPAGEFSASKESCDVHIGPNRAHGDLRRYQVQVEANGLAADLTFSGSAPAWRPGAGKIFFGDLEHYFAWLPAIPYGTVEGTLAYDGRTHHVKGSGYHDHNWGNVGLGQVMDHWLWGRAHLGGYTLIYVEQVASRAYGFARLPVFLLARDGEILVGDGGPLTMQARQYVRYPGGRQYPGAVDFHWQSPAGRVDLALRQPKLIEAVSLLLTSPKWKRLLLRPFANPFYFRLSADLDLSVDLGALEEQVRGPTLFEVMILQGRKHP